MTNTNLVKHCFGCKTDKPYSEFHKCRTNKTGIQVYCKICSKERKQRPENKIKRALYMSQDRCKRNYAHKGIQSLLTLEDVKYLWERDKAHLLKKPSLDRIDNDGDYTRENCQFIELAENTGKDKKRAVLQYDRQGNLLNTYESTVEAARSLGRHKGSISNAARGHEPAAYGFIWRYKDEQP